MKRFHPKPVRTEWPRITRDYYYSNFSYEQHTRTDGAKYYALSADVEYICGFNELYFRSIIGISAELPIIKQMVNKMEIMYIE